MRERMYPCKKLSYARQKYDQISILRKRTLRQADEEDVPYADDVKLDPLRINKEKKVNELIKIKIVKN